jgi:deoxycytidine triphosphate deaminase
VTNIPGPKTSVRSLIARVLRSLLTAVANESVENVDASIGLLESKETKAVLPSGEWLAKDDNDAQARYDKFRSVDPFPDIEPALLNSADLCDYVGATGMIFPFHPEEKNLKPASYRVSLLGTCIFWDAAGKEHEINLETGQPFVLQPNSIAFVSLEPRFRIPDYIALRFNLQITHIHRGLLLGTGPLVDPGFDGKLLIPLHNLTTNDYHFRGGDPLIWMEFTKVSVHENWKRATADPSVTRQGQYVPFFKKDGKPLIDVKSFLKKAEPTRPIRSSIPSAILSAQQAAELAAKNIRDLSLVAIATLFIGIASLLFGGFQILSYVQDVRTELQRVKDLEIEIRKLKEQNRSANTQPSPVSATGQDKSDQRGDNKSAEPVIETNSNSAAKPSPSEQ